MRRSKYHARPCVIDGVRFASQKEARRYQDLRLLERAGEITGLELQPAFPLEIADARTGEVRQVGRYVADFRYRQGGVVIVEDVKGVRTPVYRLKKKMVEAQHGVRILES